MCVEKMEGQLTTSLPGPGCAGSVHRDTEGKMLHLGSKSKRCRTSGKKRYCDPYFGSMLCVHTLPTKSTLEKQRDLEPQTLALTIANQRQTAQHLSEDCWSIYASYFNISLWY